MTFLVIRIANVKGVHYFSNKPESFIGKLTFKKSEDSVVSSWHILSEDGKFLGFKTQGVHHNIIPEGVDDFDFALNHAIEGLRRYRLNRKRVYVPQSWEWKEENSS
jgi:hypothetical protein